MSLTGTAGAPAPAIEDPLRLRPHWAERIAGNDPGLNRLRLAAQCVLTILAALLAERLFVGLTHAMQVPVPAGGGAAAVLAAAADHDLLVIAMLLGSMIGMMASFGVMDATARGQLVTMLYLPLPMLASLALGLVIAGDRIVALASFAVLLALGTYCRRFGPRGFVGGILLFMGDFLGFFLGADVKIGDFGWLAAEIGVGAVVSVVIRFAFFYPRQDKALERTQWSYAARARTTARLALQLLDDPAGRERNARRLHRQLVRLNEAALMIDAQLGDPGAVADGSTAQLLHQRLFDLELALSNIARFAGTIAAAGLPADQYSAVQLALASLCEQDADGAAAHARELMRLVAQTEPPPGESDRTVAIIAHRFAGSVVDFCAAMREWMDMGATAEGKSTFEPAVALFAGWLPGSATVGNTASEEPGQGRARLSLARYTRTAIQMGVAVGAATALGDVVSARRFYWAVIAAFIVFMGTSSSGEQVRKAVFRVAGTVVGIGIGSALVMAVGHHTYWSIAVILVALFFGFYLMRVNYAFMVIGITVMVSQLYVQLDEFSNALLVLRLEETALGSAVGVGTVLLVLPLRTRRVLRVAMREHVQAVGQLADAAAALLAGTGDVSEAALRAQARVVDAAYQALVFTAQPLRRTLAGAVDQDTALALQLASASRFYSRNLVGDAADAGPLPPDLRPEVSRAAVTLRASAQAVVDALNGSRGTPYTRSSALLDRTERKLEESQALSPGHLAVRDLKLVDETMARLARQLGLPVAAYDASPRPAPSPAGAGPAPAESAA